MLCKFICIQKKKNLLQFFSDSGFSERTNRRNTLIAEIEKNILRIIIDLANGQWITLMIDRVNWNNCSFQPDSQM